MKKLSVISLIFSLLFILSCEDKKDTSPPKTTITSPTNGSKVNEVVTITCMSTDNKEVSKVELWVDGQSTGLIDETEPYSFEWNTTDYKDGEHTLIVRGYDTSDNQGDSPPVTVNIDNTVSVPKSVSVKSVKFSNGGFTIDWSKSTDGDFKSYTLEHSVESEMNDYEEIFTTEDVNVTTTRMEDTSPLSYHYFRVTVTDTFDYQTKGSIYSSSLDPVPSPVDVKSVTYDLEKMTVEWDKSSVGDFGSYKLLYSKTEDGDKDTLETYLDNNTTTYSTSTFDPTVENWYWVIVTDTLGQYITGKGMTSNINLPPTLSTFNDLVKKEDYYILSWTENIDFDFKKYQLFKVIESYPYANWDYSKFDTTLVFESESILDTTFQVSNNLSDYYFIKTFDYWGLSSSSNQEKITTYKTFLNIIGNDGEDEYAKSLVIKNTNGEKSFDNGFIIVSTQNKNNNWNSFNLLIRWFDSEGRLKNSTYFDNFKNHIVDPVSINYGKNIGEYFIVGSTKRTDFDVNIIKISDSDVISEKDINLSGNQKGYSIVNDSNDNFYIAGEQGTVSSQGWTTSLRFINKIDNEGDISWSISIGVIKNSFSIGPYKKIYLLDGYIYVINNSDLIKLDTDGNKIWENKIKKDDSWITNMIVNNDGNLVLGGNIISIVNPNNGQLISSRATGSTTNASVPVRVSKLTEDSSYITLGNDNEINSGNRLKLVNLINDGGLNLKAFIDIETMYGRNNFYVTEDGGYLIFGTTEKTKKTYIIKTDPYGYFDKSNIKYIKD